MPGRLRRPPFGPHGRVVVASLCAYEIAALPPASPLPTISEIVHRRWLVGVVLIGLLSHHWWLEEPYVVVVPPPLTSRRSPPPSGGGASPRPAGSHR